jgi:hypothetical protein
MVVVSAYQQMRNQKEPVLSELGEDNFDSAFSFFKPGTFKCPSSTPHLHAQSLTPSLPHSYPGNRRRHQEIHSE